MLVQSLTPVMMKTTLDALLAALSARPAAALWATPNVHLFSNMITPTAESLLADFTECTFAGYAAVALPTLAGPVHLANDAQALLAEVNFIGGSVVAPGQNVMGYYITDTTNALLYVAELFGAPIPIANPGDYLTLALIFAEAAVRPTT
jgi:hypothetical protein